MVRGRGWIGFEAVALQEAMRRSIREFAAELGIDTTTVTNWRSGLGTVVPRPRMQEILDTTLEQRATPEGRARFEQIVAEGEKSWRARHHRNDVQSTPDLKAPPAQNEAKLSAAQKNRDTSSTRGDLAETARASLEFAEWTNTSVVDQLSIDSLYLDLARIATTYVQGPLWPLLGDLVAGRDQARQLLAQNPQPHQARDLLVLGGVAITMLAHVTDDLGDPFAAMQHTLAAQQLAQQADHPALKAWIAGTQALITEWSGRPGKAIGFVRRAADNAPPGHQRVRLAALEARAAARAGRADNARSALDHSRRAMDQSPTDDDLHDFGGILRFPAPKALYYEGSTLTLIGDHAEAERTAIQAITAYESGPEAERSYGDEALARADVAIARIVHHDLEGAVDVLTPVLALPAPQRIQSIRDGLTQVERHLAASRHAAAQIAHDLREEIATFTPATQQALP